MTTTSSSMQQEPTQQDEIQGRRRHAVWRHLYQVCLIAARTDVALVPCGHSRFCGRSVSVVPRLWQQWTAGCLMCAVLQSRWFCAYVQLVVTLPTANDRTLCVSGQTVYFVYFEQYCLKCTVHSFEMMNCSFFVLLF